MAFKNSAVRCSRLTRPASPSRRTTSTTAAASNGAATIGTKFKSKILTALDEQFDLNVIPIYGGSAPAERGDSGSVDVGQESAVHVPGARPVSASAGAGPGGSLANSMKPLLKHGSSQQSYASDVPRQPVSTPASAITRTAMTTFALPSSWDLAMDPATDPAVPPDPVPATPPPKSRTKASSSSAAASALKEPEEPLPIYSYKDYTPAPAVVYTRHEEEANDIVAGLKGPVGFDMEWCVSFRTGAPKASRRTALIQVSDKSVILLVHVSAMDQFPQKLKELIENASIPKVGANIRNDGTKLFADFHIAARNLVELGALAQQADPTFSAHYKRRVVSLAKMVRMYEQRDVDKGSARLSNWERVPLAEDQKIYAANDAHSGLRVYLSLLKIAEEKESVLSPEGFTSDIAIDRGLAEAPAQTVSASTTVSTVASASSHSSTVSTSTTSTTSAAPTPGSSAPAPAPAISAARQAYIARLAAAVEGDLQPPRLRPQHLRAYRLWHHHGMALDDIRAALRSKEDPLTAGTVITYVVKALQADNTLPYSHEKLRALAQSEGGSWARHRGWILGQERKRVNSQT